MHAISNKVVVLTSTFQVILTEAKSSQFKPKRNRVTGYFMESKREMSREALGTIRDLSVPLHP